MNLSEGVESFFSVRFHFGHASGFRLRFNFFFHAEMLRNRRSMTSRHEVLYESLYVEPLTVSRFGMGFEIESNQCFSM